MVDTNVNTKGITIKYLFGAAMAIFTELMAGY